MNDVNADYEIVEEENTPKKRGRKPNGKPDRDVQATEIVLSDGEKEEQEKQEIINVFGITEEYDRFTCIEEIKGCINLSGKYIYEAGKRLIWMKANEPHGSWLPLLEQMEVSTSFASRAMRAARKYAKFPKLGNLRYPAMQVTFDFADDELQDLEDGKEVRGLTLEELQDQSKSKKELLAMVEAKDKALKEQKEKLEAVIQKKTEKINEQDRELRYQQPPTRRQKAEADLVPYKEDLPGVIAVAAVKIKQVLSVLDKGQHVEGIEVDQLDAWMREELVVENFNQLNDYFEDLKTAVEQIRPLWKPGRE